MNCKCSQNPCLFVTQLKTFLEPYFHKVLVTEILKFVSVPLWRQAACSGNYFETVNLWCGTCLRRNDYRMYDFGSVILEKGMFVPLVFDDAKVALYAIEMQKHLVEEHARLFDSSFSCAFDFCVVACKSKT